MVTKKTTGTKSTKKEKIETTDSEVETEQVPSEFSEYKSALIDLHGIDTQFIQSHIPFLVVDDVVGAIALEGSSGTGKTTLVKRLGMLNEQVTGGRVKVYSADKARYEDFNGCPIPETGTREMVIYPMPNSVAQMETVLVDELNRASYETSEKWFSLLASREIDGLATKCKYVFAAMNPLMSENSDKNDTYEGVQPLDKAMGERLMALIRMPAFNELPCDIRMQIIGEKSANWKPNAESVSMFKRFVAKAREIYEQIKEGTEKQTLIDYVDQFQDVLCKETKNHIRVEGRRAQFLLYNTIAIRALRLTTGVDNIEEAVLESISIGFPNTLWEQPVNFVQLKKAHDLVKDVLWKKVTAKAKTSKKSNVNVLDQIRSDLTRINESDYNLDTLSKTLANFIVDRPVQPDLTYYTSIAAVNNLCVRARTELKKEILKAEELDQLNRAVQEIKNFPESVMLDELIKEFVVSLDNTDIYNRVAEKVKFDQLSHLNYTPQEFIMSIMYEDSSKLTIAGVLHDNVYLTEFAFMKQHTELTSIYNDCLEKIVKAL